MCSILELQISNYQLWCNPNAEIHLQGINSWPWKFLLLRSILVSDIMIQDDDLTEIATKNQPPTVLGYNSQGDIELMGHRSQITTTRGISPCNNATIAAQCYKCTGWRLDRFHITEFLNENTFLSWEKLPEVGFDVLNCYEFNTFLSRESLGF